MQQLDSMTTGGPTPDEELNKVTDTLIRLEKTTSSPILDQHNETKKLAAFQEFEDFFIDPNDDGFEECSIT